MAEIKELEKKLDELLKDNVDENGEVEKVALATLINVARTKEILARVVEIEAKQTTSQKEHDLKVKDFELKKKNGEDQAKFETKKFENQVQNQDRDFGLKEFEVNKKVELDQAKFELEKIKTENSDRFEQARLEIEKLKLELENNKYVFTMEQAKVDNQIKASELKIKDFEAGLKRDQVELSKKAERNKLIIAGITVGVPAAVGLISNIICIRNYNKLAVRALNMEYIDNNITPRSYTEAMNNVKNFISKK